MLQPHVTTCEGSTAKSFLHLQDFCDNCECVERAQSILNDRRFLRSLNWLLTGNNTILTWHCLLINCSLTSFRSFSPSFLAYLVSTWGSLWGILPDLDSQRSIPVERNLRICLHRFILSPCCLGRLLAWSNHL